MGYVQTHTHLALCSLNAEQHERTCGYWYTITESGMSHRAFRRRTALIAWLELVGLTATVNIPEPGTYSYQRLDGTYRTEAHLHPADVLRFGRLDGMRSRTLSNGDYVTAIVTTDAAAIRTVHTLNPNVTHRMVYDYAESEGLFA